MSATDQTKKFNVYFVLKVNVLRQGKFHTGTALVVFLKLWRIKMETRICHHHSKVRENGEWRFSNIGKFLLYHRKPVLVVKCDDCEREENIRKTLEALRSQNEV
jgi:hypothetical protein